MKLRLQFIIVFTFLSLAVKAEDLSYEQQMCLEMSEAQAAVSKGELGLPARYYVNHGGTDLDQDIYCNNTSPAWGTTITQFISELKQNKKVIDLYKNTDNGDGPSLEIENTIEREHPGEGKSATAQKLDPPEKSDVAMPVSRSQSRIGNGQCFEGLKEPVAENFKSKPIIEIYICGKCPTTSEDPYAVTNIKRANLRIFSNQVKKKDAHMYLSYFSINASGDCSYYTYINPTERPSKKKVGRRQSGSADVGSVK